MRITHLSLEKKAAQKLAARALYSLYSGDVDSAVKNIHAMLAFVNGTHEERTAISQLVRIAITQIAIAATWEFLQSPNLTDEQLAGLQTDWSQLEFIRSAENVLPVEREGGETNLAKWRSSNSELQHYFDLQKQVQEAMGNFNEEDSEESFWNKTKRKIKIFLWRYWWSYADELRSLKGYEALMDTMRLADTNRSFQKALATQDVELNRLGISQLKSSFDSIFSGETDFHSMMSESIITLAGSSEKLCAQKLQSKL
jgi:hypothetical protein